MEDPRDKIGERYFQEAVARAKPGWTKLPECLDCGVRLPRNRSEHTGTVTHNDGCPYAASLDETSAKDRAFFETHTQATEYWRKPSYSEMTDIRVMEGIEAEGTFRGRVLVRRIADGVRQRYLGNVYFVPAE